MPAVLITRPQATAEHLAHILQDHGYSGAIEPLLSIIMTAAARPEDLAVQAVMLTSANALEILKTGAYDISDLLNLPCFCVGPQTEAKARALGFQMTQSSTSDGAELAKLISSLCIDKNKTILHIGAEDVDSKAKDELEHAGFNVALWPIYIAQPAAKLSDATIKLLKLNKLDAVIVYSVKTAETLKSLLQQHELMTCCGSLIAIGLSGAVADTLKPIPWKKLVAANQPTEDAVINCLKETLPVS